MIDPKLNDKVVLTTGANHGIGAATAQALAAQEAKVFITYYREEHPYSAQELKAAREDGNGGDRLYRAMQQQSGETVTEQIRAEGGTAVAHEADLADANTIPRLFDWCEAKLGPVDILINNHTYCVLETFDPKRTTEEESGIYLPTAPVIDAHFQINTRACALMMSEYLKRYLARGATWGRIINTSTDAAHAHPENVSYAASKHAIESYSRSAAAEMGNMASPSIF